MNKLRQLCLWLTVVSSLIGFSSCDTDDDYYPDYLSGYWYYQGRADGDDWEGDYNEFFFAPDGTGTYSCYSEGGTGPWTTYDITWRTAGSYIYISVWGWESWSYSYDVSPRWLYLYPADGGSALIYSAG